MKKVFNPTVGGKPITLHGDILNVNESVDMSDIEGGKLMKRFPFLVDLNEPRFQPDFWQPKKLSLFTRFLVKIKRTWLTLRINLQQ